jgi:hypothetical protein
MRRLCLRRGSIGKGSRRSWHRCRNHGVPTGRPDADPYRFPLGLGQGWHCHQPRVGASDTHCAGGDAGRSRVCGHGAQWPSVVPLRTCRSMACLRTHGSWNTQVIPIMLSGDRLQKVAADGGYGGVHPSAPPGRMRTISRALVLSEWLSGGPPRARAVRTPPFSSHKRMQMVFPFHDNTLPNTGVTSAVKASFQTPGGWNDRPPDVGM